MVVPPEVVAPVEPLVPELLLVPVEDGLVDDEDEPDGELDVELPEEPMPELVPELE